MLHLCGMRKISGLYRFDKDTSSHAEPTSCGVLDSRNGGAIPSAQWGRCCSRRDVKPVTKDTIIKTTDHRAQTLVAEQIFPVVSTPTSSALLQQLGDSATFDKLYVTEDKIGQGAFGTVYGCRPVHDASHAQGRLCVKIVPLCRQRAFHTKARGGEVQELFTTCAKFEHPNLVQHHKFFQSHEALFTIMDRCCGPDLVDHVASCGGVLSVSDVRTFAQQILGALTAVHALGVMHRDIKLENFRFNDASAQQLKLLDFGFAKPCSGTPAQHSLTGSLIYVAPEVLSGVYSRSCDLWGAGVVVYQLLSRQPPFNTSDIVMLRSMHRDPVLTGSALFRGSLWAAVPSVTLEFLRGLLSVDPVKRLTAAAASWHAWFGGPVDDDAGGLPDAPPLKRSPSSLAELKRSYYVWDLAAGGEDSDDAF